MSLISNTMNRTKEGQNKFKTHIVDAYNPTIDYSIFDITDNEKNKLIECEKELLRGKQEIEKGTFIVAKALYEAQEALANYAGGTFYKWFESFGLKKTFVYMALKRYKIFLKYGNKEISNLPDRAITEIAKLEERIENIDIKEIIEAPKPLKKLEEIKERLSVRRTTDEEIQEVEIIESDMEKLIRIRKEIKYHQEVIKELKEIEKELEKKIN